VVKRRVQGGEIADVVITTNAAIMILFAKRKSRQTALLSSRVRALASRYEQEQSSPT
jgi:hypothetical protein